MDAVRIPAVAEAAGVSRPVVYRHFDNRSDLLAALVEDYSSRLEARFARTMAEVSIEWDFDGLIHALLHATCDAIEAEGAGVWRLVASRGPDREIDGLVRQVAERMRSRWLPHIRAVSGASLLESDAFARMAQATTFAVLDAWVDGVLEREHAIELGARAVIGLLRSLADEPE